MDDTTPSINKLRKEVRSFLYGGYAMFPYTKLYDLTTPDLTTKI